MRMWIQSVSTEGGENRGHTLASRFHNVETFKMSQSKKQKVSTGFFKPKEKSVPLKSEEIITTAIPLQKMNYVGDCPLFFQM